MLPRPAWHPILSRRQQTLDRPWQNHGPTTARPRTSPALGEANRAPFHEPEAVLAAREDDGSILGVRACVLRWTSIE